MKFVTQKEAREAGRKSLKGAIDCSVKHWDQLATCTEAELKAKLNSLRDWHVYIYSAYCALCLRLKENCSKCVFGICNMSDSSWSLAKRAFTRWWHSEQELRAEAFSAFQEAAANVRDDLKKFRATGKSKSK